MSNVKCPKEEALAYVTPTGLVDIADVKKCESALSAPCPLAAENERLRKRAEQAEAQAVMFAADLFHADECLQCAEHEYEQYRDVMLHTPKGLTVRAVASQNIRLGDVASKLRAERDQLRARAEQAEARVARLEEALQKIADHYVCRESSWEDLAKAHGKLVTSARAALIEKGE